MGTLMVDFITSLDGYGAAEGWQGWRGMESPEYLGWLGVPMVHPNMAATAVAVDVCKTRPCCR
jgi:hypothetical protein